MCQNCPHSCKKKQQLDSLCFTYSVVSSSVVVTFCLRWMPSTPPTYCAKYFFLFWLLSLVWTKSFEILHNVFFGTVKRWFWNLRFLLSVYYFVIDSNWSLYWFAVSLQGACCGVTARRCWFSSQSMGRIPHGSLSPKIEEEIN